MPQRWMMTINGHPMKKNMGKREAELMAERWQGSHSGNRGLLKHKDRGDWVEVKRDYDSEKEFDRRLDLARRGHPQNWVMVGTT